jgi:hypothetical protein
MHINGNVTLISTTVGPSGSTISSNATVNGSSATINSAVEAVTSTGGTYNSTWDQPRHRTNHALGTVYDYYNTNGTAISISGIPKTTAITPLKKSSSVPVPTIWIESQHKSIYIINCGDRKSSSRIAGYTAPLYH